MHIVSLGDHLHTIISLLSAESAKRVVKVKILILGPKPTWKKAGFSVDMFYIPHKMGLDIFHVNSLFRKEVTENVVFYFLRK